ncbi:MAG: proline dehydrogenase family protein [Candidatus Sungbacteria bacterium]|nr:proline dehydrogenase family protein [Candidatus Sungbacteria bacterium]
MLKEAAARMLGFATANILPKQLVWFFARRFIAGTDMKSAIEYAKTLNNQEFSVSIDCIGEERNDAATVLWAKNEYLALLGAMQKHAIYGDISLKLSHFGLLQKDVPQAVRGLGLSAFQSIVNKAAKHQTRVWIDAERLDWRSSTWQLIRLLFPPQSYRWIGLCIQAYAKDSLDFLKREIEIGGYCGYDSISVRVCKGAYREPGHQLYASKELEENFLKLCRLVLDNGLYLQVATNDDGLAERVSGFGPREYAMLLGANPEGARWRLADHNNVKIYMPYGADFKSYVARRIAERPEYIFLPFKTN